MANIINGISEIGHLSDSTFTKSVFKVVDLGYWNMDKDLTKNVPHGLSATEWKTINDICVIVKNDDNPVLIPLDCTYDSIVKDSIAISNNYQQSYHLHYNDKSNIDSNRESLNWPFPTRFTELTSPYFGPNTSNTSNGIEVGFDASTIKVDYNLNYKVEMVTYGRRVPLVAEIFLWISLTFKYNGAVIHTRNIRSDYSIEGGANNTNQTWHYNFASGAQSFTSIISNMANAKLTLETRCFTYEKWQFIAQPLALKFEPVALLMHSMAPSTLKVSALSQGGILVDSTNIKIGTMPLNGSVSYNGTNDSRGKVSFSYTPD